MMDVDSEPASYGAARRSASGATLKMFGRLLLAGLAAAVLASPAASQKQGTPASPVMPQIASKAMTQAAFLSPSQRIAISHDLIAKWQSAAAKRPGGDGPRWAEILSKAVAAADAANVIDATTARSVDELHAVLSGADVIAQPIAGNGTISNGTVSPQALGSYVADLSYTPLPYGRCRVADSRAINYPLVGTRHLKLEGMANYASQGGTGTYQNGTGSTACGIPYYAAAYALSISVISPSSSGYFKVFKFGTPYQTGNSISMNVGTYASADIVARSCQACNSEYSIYSAASVHYIIDVIGYYLPPQKTKLSCYNTPYLQYQVGINEQVVAFAPSCNAGYAAVSTTCYPGHIGVFLSAQGDGLCAAKNLSGFASTMRSSVVCCQIPGR